MANLDWRACSLDDDDVMMQWLKNALKLKLKGTKGFYLPSESIHKI